MRLISEIWINDALVSIPTSSHKRLEAQKCIQSFQTAVSECSATQNRLSLLFFPPKDFFLESLLWHLRFLTYLSAASRL